ncbi:MAG TPA: UDP binding domain-containing protein, partial [Vicinamibacteria bacterium]
ILRILESRGGRVQYHDPHVPELALDGVALRSVDLLPSVKEADIVVIVTDHSSYPWPRIVETAALVLDTRNATRGIVSDKLLRI